MPDGGLRRSAKRRHTHHDQKRTNWLLVGLCITVLIVFVLIFAPLMTLRETDNNRSRRIQREQYEIADEWVNIFRTMLMDAAYAGNLVEGLVLSGQPALPNLTAPPGERTQGQYVAKFDAVATYIFASLPTLSYSYLSPGGIINQCFPNACPTQTRDLLSPDDPSNVYTPTGPEVAASGRIGYVGPIRNNITASYQMEWVIQARLPIYVTSERDQFGMKTFWGFSSNTVNITGIVRNENMHKRMDENEMDFLLFRVGTRTGFVYTVACNFPGCDVDGNGGNEDDERIPSQDALKAFMNSGSGPVTVLQGSTFALTVRSRRQTVYLTPSMVARVVMAGVGVGLLWAVVSIVLVFHHMPGEGGLVSPAPKRAPFAVVTIGPSRADALWREAPEAMHATAGPFLACVKRAAERHGGYPVPRVHPYTHSFATRTVTAAVELAFEVLTRDADKHMDAELADLLGVRDGRTLIACAVHWCTDAAVRLTSLSDPYPYRYEGPDVAHAGETWVVAAPNTVTLTLAALDHLEQHEPARRRRSLHVVPYVHQRDPLASSLSSPASPNTASHRALNGTRAVTASSADQPDARTARPSGSPLFVVTDPQQPRLRHGIEAARAYCGAPLDANCADTHVERFQLWNNVRPVSGSGSEAGGSRTIAESSRVSMLEQESLVGEFSSRGLENSLPIPVLPVDGGLRTTPSHGDFGVVSPTVLVPASSTTVPAANGLESPVGDEGSPLSASDSLATTGNNNTNTTGSTSSVITSLTWSSGRFGRAGSRNPGVVINVSQGAASTLEVRDDPLGQGAPFDRHEVEGTPLTDLHWGSDTPHVPLTEFAPADNAEERMSGIVISESTHGTPWRDPARHVMTASSSTSSNTSFSALVAANGTTDADGAGRVPAGAVPSITAYEAWHPRRHVVHTPRHAEPSEDGRYVDLHVRMARVTRDHHSDSLTLLESSRGRSTHPSARTHTRTSEDGDALTQILLHPPIPKYLDDSLRFAFQYQAVGLALPYEAVQVLAYYIYNGYKLLFRPLAAVEQANIYQRFVVAFGVPAINTLEHLAAWAAIRYVEQHDETRRLCAPVMHHIPAATAADRHESSQRSDVPSGSGAASGSRGHHHHHAAKSE